MVQLLLLSRAKHDLMKNNPEKDFTAIAFNSPQLTKVVVRCNELLKRLKEYIQCGDGGKEKILTVMKLVCLHKAQYHSII